MILLHLFSVSLQFFRSLSSSMCVHDPFAGDLGHKMGRIHMHRQNLTKIALKKQRGHSYKRQKLASGKAKAATATSATASSDAE